MLLAIGFRGAANGTPDSRPRWGFLLLWLLLPIVCFWLVPPLFGVTLLAVRYVLFAAPAALFLMAWVLASGNRIGWRKWMPLGVFLTLTFAWNLIPALRTSGTFSHWAHGDWAKATAVVDAFAHPDDLILLRTGDVEADLLARSNPDPLLISFTSWPVTAHLPSNHPYQIVSLPFRDNDHTRLYMAGLLSTAARHRRVWIIGKGRMFPSIVRALVTDAHFTISKQLSYGLVRVLALEQAGTPPDDLTGDSWGSEQSVLSYGPDEPPR